MPSPKADTQADTEPRRLTTYVAVMDENGNTQSFGPNDVVPQWAADKITNPRAWTTDPL